MESILEHLESHPFLKGLGADQLQRLATFAELQVFDEEACIIRQGEPADRFYLIERGKVVVEISPAHHGDVKIQTIYPGEVLGWSWLIEPHEWEFDARVDDYTRVIALDAHKLRECMKGDRELGMDLLQRMLQVVVRRLRATRIQFWDIYKLHYLIGGKTLI